MGVDNREMTITAAKRQLHESDGSLAYWLSRPVEERLAQLQALRVEYFGWDDEAGPRLQRIHRVLHRP